jgi:hypothetical protein
MYTQREVFHAFPRKERLDIAVINLRHLCPLLLVGQPPGLIGGGLRLGGLLETIIALVVVQVVLTAAAAIVTPKEAQAPRDERDKLIELKATRVAYSGLATCVALACFFGAFDPPIVFNTNALLLFLVAAELLRSSCQIIQYRRSG